MDATTQSRGQNVTKFVQTMLLDESDRSRIGRELIAEKIEQVLRMMPLWGVDLDREAVTDELVRRFSMVIGRSGSLAEDGNHVAWLDAERKRGWRLWQRYREYQEEDLPEAAVEALDLSTERILELLEDPRREDGWDRRGLVVGHVQSGKTANYTGLICKAADAGYKIIIVLAGLHNNLRSQTQIRLDEGFLGFETAPSGADLVPIGVGLKDGDPAIRPNFATNRTERGDFSTRAAAHLGVKPEQRPWLFVVKKNKAILQQLLAWIRNHVANGASLETGQKVVTNLPLLVVDDEADHASVDTGEDVIGENGLPDEEHSPTAINSLVRQILNSFSRKAYVGYTATPFANIFIHEKGRTRLEGPDLFPSSFIISLAAPSTYVGPARVFGLRAGASRSEGLPLIREVTDFEDEGGIGGWMPQGHKSSHRVPELEEPFGIPSSLRRAVLSFLLACAARRCRGQGHKHASMLVHVTRFKAVQEQVHEQVEDTMRSVRQRLQRGIGDADLRLELRQLWERDFVPVTDGILQTVRDPSIKAAGWGDIEPVLAEVAADIQVRMINGTSRDVLDYVDKAAVGLKVIAIGGDKLARGLTLEGLCTSYFLRASRMYDTLMQMGRWFGYRPGYLDLCRLYTTSDLVEWFEHIADASEELREEFDLMEASGGTPRDYGLKVQSHPVLTVTSRIKMRTARTLMLSFSGRLLETVVLHRDPTVLAANLDELRKLIANMGIADEPGSIRRDRPDEARHEWEGWLWRGVDAAVVVAFLRRFQTHRDAPQANAQVLAGFIEQMTDRGELTRWTVAVIGSGGDRDPIALGTGISVGMPVRKRKHGSDADDRYSIGRLLSPRDEGIDLDASSWQAALDRTRLTWSADPARAQNPQPELPSGPAMREVRGFGSDGIAAQPNTGLLLLYVLDPVRAGAGINNSVEGVVAFGISFPGSKSGVKVEYKVANLAWEQEYARDVSAGGD